MKSNLRNSRLIAFTLIELIVVVAVLALLAVTFLPAAIGDDLLLARQRAQRINCVNNLKQVGISFKVWALDNDDKYPMTVSNRLGGTLEFVAEGNAFRHFQVMSNELTTPKLVICPADDRKQASSFADLENKTVSYFVGLDANDSNPAAFLSGDRNITNGVAPVKTVLALNPEIPTGWTETIHINQGNVGLADGSVQQCSSLRLQQAVQNAGATNRIAIPE